MKTTEHLIDRLTGATVTAPRPEYVGIQPITIGRETRPSLFQHPPSVVEFAGLTLGRRPVLHLGCGIKEVAWPKLKSAIHFELTLTDRRGRDHELLQLTVDPAGDAGQRRWLDHAHDLSRFAGQTVTLRLTTAVVNGTDGSYCWAGWSDPFIAHDTVPAVRRQRPDHHRHVVLITADALRADHLGCYGHPLVRTPHLDQLARDGCLFTHARAQATTTLGSYASLLTSRYPTEHGILAEWGELAGGLTTLPEYLAAHGYHTLLAASEAEQLQGELAGRFAERLPCLAAPAQTGAITTRHFARWLDRRPDQPFFAWVQFFDSHPPCTAPEPFRSLYYQGDPAHERARYAPERLAAIRGVECVMDLDLALEQFPHGIVPVTFLERLHDTAEVLLGRRVNGPDLVSHLQGLGVDACNGLSPAAFGDWLLREVGRLREGIVTPELLRWLHDLRPRLCTIEEEILSWLRGVVDFRYPMHQYMSQVTHLDHHVGTLLADLKERGLYDQTLIVFASPHGEALAEDALVMHHHGLLESVLRVPVLLKPAGSPAGFQPGRRLTGVLDLIDLFPTALAGVGLPPAFGSAGVDRWPHICTGTPIPDHDSLAVELHRCVFALARPPYVFLKAYRPYYVTPEWCWQPGDRRLFELAAPMRYDRNLIDEQTGQATSMEQRLEAWLERPAEPRKRRQQR